MLRLLSVVRKEVLHIWRDRRTLAVMLLIPVVQLILLGYAATTDVEHLRTAVFDGDHSQSSRELLETYRASNYFDFVRYVQDQDEIEQLIESGEVRAGLIIPYGYGKVLAQGKRAEICFVIDGSDPSVASTAFSAVQSVGQAASMKIIRDRTGMDIDELSALDVRPRVLYNPEMKSVNFMIPGLIATILQALTTVFTSVAIVREREQGTIEQLIVTPIRSYELLIGKVIPYTVITFLDLGEVLLIGIFWFKVPVRGNLFLLLILALFFLVTSLGLGLLISTLAKTQQEAMLLSYFTLLPSIFLSGFFSPVEAMPPVLQRISYIIPLRYMLIMVRGIIIKGVGFHVLWREVLVVGLFGLAIMGLAVARFRKRLE